MPLDPLSGISQDFFSSISTLLRGTPDDSYSVIDCLGNRTGCA
jgi:hypothetical protein